MPNREDILSTVPPEKIDGVEEFRTLLDDILQTYAQQSPVAVSQKLEHTMKDIRKQQHEAFAALLEKI